MAVAGPLHTFEQVLSHVSKTDAVFYATYANAAMVTVTVIMLFAALYLHCRFSAVAWATVGVAFVPIYGTMNLVVYLAQITVVPRLLNSPDMEQHRALSVLLLRQAIQLWPDSTAFIVNNLGYAVLGVPSIIFGVLLFKVAPALRVGGALLALSGAASIVGFVGIVVQSSWLGHGSLVGGVLFLLALVSMSSVFLDPRQNLWA